MFELETKFEWNYDGNGNRCCGCCNLNAKDLYILLLIDHLYIVGSAPLFATILPPF